MSLVARRRLIAEGWRSYAGAAHLWAAYLAGLGPGEEADPPAMALADDVQAELEEWLESLRRGRV